MGFSVKAVQWINIDLLQNARTQRRVSVTVMAGCSALSMTRSAVYALRFLAVLESSELRAMSSLLETKGFTEWETSKWRVQCLTA